MIRAGLVAMLMASVPQLVPAQPAPEPEGYREDEYRAPVPVTLEGATVIDSNAAHALWKTGRVAFVDVFPQAPRPANLPADTIWRDKPRLSVPGATWLPNVGYGRIADETEAYFRAGLVQATNGDPSMPIVFYCLEDCWMSWNAGKRVQGWGYDHVFWYPEGTDGWAFFDYPLERVTPFAE